MSIDELKIDGLSISKNSNQNFLIKNFEEKFRVNKKLHKNIIFY